MTEAGAVDRPVKSNRQGQMGSIMRAVIGKVRS